MKALVERMARPIAFLVRRVGRAVGRVACTAAPAVGFDDAIRGPHENDSPFDGPAGG